MIKYKGLSSDVHRLALLLEKSIENKDFFKASLLIKRIENMGYKVELQYKE